MKSCLRCEQLLPLESFSRHRSRPDGRQAYCKPCTRSANLASMRRNAERQQILTPTEKRCGGCGETKPGDDFYPDRRRRDGLHANCRGCHYRLTRRWQKRNPSVVKRIAKASYDRNADACRRRAREYRAANIESARARCAEWKRQNAAQAAAVQNIRRARQMGAAGTATPEQIAARVSYYGGRCWMCGDPWEHIDHVKPVAVGGPNWPSNLRPACADCNLRKGSRWGGVGALAAVA